MKTTGVKARGERHGIDEGGGFEGLDRSCEGYDGEDASGGIHIRRVAGRG